MAFKSIQLGIPTVLIKNSGQTSCFKDYDGLFDINDDMLTYIKQYKLKEDFLNNTLVGGIDFNSTSLVLEKIKEFLNEKY